MLESTIESWMLKKANLILDKNSTVFLHFFSCLFTKFIIEKKLSAIF